MKKIVTIISLMLCLFLFRGMSYGQNIDIDSDDNSKVDGAAEAVGAGWDSDVDAPQKKNLYDYLVGIDADLDGDLGDGIVTLSANWVNTANPWAVNEGGTGAATFTDGGLLVGATASAFEALAVGLTTQVLVGGGAATNPAWGTDLPTAVTIGTAYIYRVGGTDVSDADVVDTLTITNISQVQDITASAAEINILDNVTGVTAAELSYIGDVTSAIQEQLDAKLTALTNEAGLYAELSDVTRFFEINDNDPTWGTSDTDDATVTVYGDGAGNGGKIDLYNSTSEDGTDEYWRIEANGESLNVGPTNALTAFVFNRDGSINKSATPKLTFDDTDGADGYIDLNATDADDATMTIGVDDSVGDDTPYITLNGTTETIALSKPTTAPSVDAGLLYEANTGAYSLQTNYPTTCRMMLVNGDDGSDSIWTLPNTGICDTTEDSMKEFTFVNNDPTHDLIITPGSGDKIIRYGSGGEDCTADTSLYVDVYGTVKLIGRTASTWFAIPMGATALDCGASP